jgi:ubiquitin-activating enzyme E1
MVDVHYNLCSNQSQNCHDNIQFLLPNHNTAMHIRYGRDSVRLLLLSVGSDVPVRPMCVLSGGSSAFYTQTAIVPVRGTSGTTITISQTGSITTTVPYQTAVIIGAATPSHGLSGGAIAGIVIGIIAGLILLFLLCACLCFKTLWDGLLSIFGIRRRRTRRTEETYIDRRSSRRHNGGRTWFGTRPARGSRTSVDVVEKRRTSGGWGGLAAVGAALGGLALFLGLKRRRDRRRDDDKSSVSYDSYYYYSSDYISASELS